MDDGATGSHGHGRKRGWRRPELLVLAASVVAALAVIVVASQLTATDPAGGSATEAAGRTRTYYIAADHVVWDYAPAGLDVISGEPWDETSGVFTVAGPDRVGTRYLKSLYREYTDATFTTLAPRPAAWEHLGFLGPVIHVEVGDTLEIVFRNNLDRPVSIHLHGLRYDKGSEGAVYEDGTPAEQRGDDAVPPSGTYTYRYTVPERAGPGPMDGSSVMWMYHSHTDEVGDVYSGLMGPVVVTRKGMARPDGSPVDVDRELVSVFAVEDENTSSDSAANLAALAQPPEPADEAFVESNLMHSINGYVYGNGPLGSAPGEGTTVQVGQHVRWYLMAMGTEVDLHTPHWHGNTVVANGMRTDVVSLLPAQMVTADMTADDPGVWLYHCHVADHIAAGMVTRYQVSP